MRYGPDILEQIRDRLPVSTVVGRRVSLKKAGREWKGLSPFNAEKTPSFYVNDQKQFYHCFSSGKHGDIFSFVMETEGLTFPETVERLAAEAGVALPRETQEDRETEVKRKTLYEVMELSAQFFEANLAGPAGAKARDYLDRRGLSPEIRKRFRIGYSSPDRYTLRDHLAGKGVPVEMMAETGMLVTAEDIKVPYDRFRDRVMFPISDLRGRVIAFGGRTMAADVPAKYLNSPDTPLFNKGHLLYNNHLARNPAHDKGTIVAVEGYVDVISLAVAGIHHAVAPLGTALTEHQLALLWRMADEPILCFDGDKAGRRAAFRALDVALPQIAAGKSLRFALLPDGQDPDDLARAGGAPAVERVLAGALPMVEMLWTREIEAAPHDTPERRAALRARLHAALAHIGDETLRQYYREDINGRIAALNPYQRERQNNFAQRQGGGRRYEGGGRGAYPAGRVSASPNLARSQLVVGGDRTSPREAMILGALVFHSELLHSRAETLAALEFDSPDARELCAVLLDCAAQSGGDPGAEVLQARLERAGQTARLAAILARVRHGDRWALDPHADKIRLQDALNQALTLHHRERTLHKELELARQLYAENEDEESWARLLDLQNQLHSVEGTEAVSDKG